MDTAGQHHDRTPVRHLRKAETATAIRVDRGAAGIEGRHTCAWTLAFATLADQSRLVPRMMSTGEAMKIDE